MVIYLDSNWISIRIKKASQVMPKKIQVSFSDKQIELIQALRGELGDSESEVVRAIVTSWFVEQGLIKTVVTDKILKNIDEHKVRDNDKG